MGGRLYDPELGIFLSPDPLVAEPFSAQGWNPYAYVGNRPLSRVDPTGFSFAPVGCNLGGVLCPGGGAGGGGASPGGASARTLWAVEFARRVLWLPVVDVFRGSEGGGFSHYWVPVRYTVWSAARVKAGVDRQPADEPMRMPSPHLRAVVRASVYAVRGAIIWKNTSVEMSVDGDKHRYRISVLICRGSTPRCDARLAKEVFDDVNDDDIPFTFDDETTGPRTLLWFFPIDHTVTMDALQTVNADRGGPSFRSEERHCGDRGPQGALGRFRAALHRHRRRRRPLPPDQQCCGVPLFLCSSVWTLWKARHRLAQSANAAGPEP